MKLTIDELQEQAASLDDLVAHPAWTLLLDAVYALFGEKATLARIATASAAPARTAESVALTTAEAISASRTAQQCLLLPGEMAKKRRQRADEARQKAAHDDRSAAPLGPDVEVTTGLR